MFNHIVPGVDAAYDGDAHSEVADALLAHVESCTDTLCREPVGEEFLCPQGLRLFEIGTELERRFWIAFPDAEV